MMRVSRPSSWMVGGKGISLLPNVSVCKAGDEYLLPLMGGQVFLSGDIIGPDPPHTWREIWVQSITDSDLIEMAEPAIKRQWMRSGPRKERRRLDENGGLLYGPERPAGSLEPDHALALLRWRERSKSSRASRERIEREEKEEAEVRARPPVFRGGGGCESERDFGHGMIWASLDYDP